MIILSLWLNKIYYSGLKSSGELKNSGQLWKFNVTRLCLNSLGQDVLFQWTPYFANSFVPIEFVLYLLYYKYAWAVEIEIWRHGYDKIIAAPKFEVIINVPTVKALEFSSRFFVSSLALAKVRDYEDAIYYSGLVIVSYKGWCHHIYCLRAATCLIPGIGKWN